MKIITFRPRFVRDSDLSDLSNLWHLSNTATQPKATRYNRMIWASNEFHKAHDYVSATGAYKDLDDMLSFGGR